MKILRKRAALVASVGLGMALGNSSPAATYYVDARSGNDVSNGALASPWRTLRKAADTMKAGDTALVRAGTYRETVAPQSGQTFAAYESEKPLITGCDPVSGWTVCSGSIYKARVNAKVLDVFAGATPMQKARHPNEDGDPLTCGEWEAATNSLQSAGGRGTGKVVLSKTSRPAGHWVGGWYCGVHGKNPFMVAEGRITASSGTELTCTDLGPGWKGVYGQMSGEGRGYITDHLNCLDAEKEWHWQDGALYFRAPGDGTPAHVEARTRIYGFILTNQSDVTLKGLYFLGASVQINGGSDNVLDGCHFRHVSPWGTHYYTDARNYYWGGTVDGTSGIHLAGTNHTIRNCSVVGGSGNGIHLAGGENLTVSNNYVADFGWSGRFVQSPVSGFGVGLNIVRNTILRSSGPGIFLYQKNPGDGSNVNHVKQVRILHNDIRDCGYLLDDSGNAFIYIQNADVPSADRALHGEIAYNVLIRQLGGQSKHHTGGIYLDNGTDFCTIHHNVVNMQEIKNPRTAAVFLNAAGHNQEDILVAHNTLWGYRGGHMFGGGIVFSTGVSKGGRQTGVVVRNNLAQHEPMLRLNDWPYGKSNQGAGVTPSHNRGKALASEFLDPTHGNFRLKPGSASIDAGAVIPGINDAASASPFAGTAPDLGAYEHGGKDWTAGSTIKIPPAFPNASATPMASEATASNQDNTVKSTNPMTKNLLIAKLLLVMSSCLASGAETIHADVSHVVVRKPPEGLGFMAPNNGGIWSWGDEILVMYVNGPHKNGTGCGSHSTQEGAPGATYDTSRSLDGGVTWAEHRTAFPRHVKSTGWPDPQPVRLTTPLDFTDPNTIVHFQRDDTGLTYLYVSTDRGRNWRGPYNNIPKFLNGVDARTCYEVTGPKSLTAYMQAATTKTDTCARYDSYAVHTTDGGLTWTLGPKISVLPECGTGWKIEWATHPSVTRVDANTLIASFRSGHQHEQVWTRTGWFDLTRSTDNGKTWSHLIRLGESPGNNSCPNSTVVVPLPGGRKRVVTLMWLRPPDKQSCEKSKLLARFSDDKGDTWSDPITLRDDVFGWDTGYPIATVRADGKIVVCYWLKTVNQDESNYIGATIWDSASGARETFSIDSERNIFAPGTNNRWAVSPHASTIAQTTDGVIVAAWWAGEAERMPGNDVWMSRFINGAWTTPYKAADGDEIEKDYTVENPTLFQPAGGPLMLFYYAGIPKRKDVDKYGRQMWGFIKTSTDNGLTWSAARALGKDERIEGGKLIGPTKNPPIQLADGSILIPSNNEPALLAGGMDEKIWAKSHKWHFEKSTDMGKTWFVVAILPENREFNAIQPGFLRLGGGKLLALGRNEGKGPETPCASSSDNGQTWSGITGLAALKQTHAGICPRTLSDGSHICILNPSTEWRNRLDLMTSTDGITWNPALILNPSEDGYMAHYPQAVQTADGKLHVVFSYGKRDQPNTGTIRHMIVNTGLKGGAPAGTPATGKARSTTGRLVGHWGERLADAPPGVDVPDLLDPAQGNTAKDDGVFGVRKPPPAQAATWVSKPPRWATEAWVGRSALEFRDDGNVAIPLAPETAAASLSLMRETLSVAAWVRLDDPQADGWTQIANVKSSWYLERHGDKGMSSTKYPGFWVNLDGFKGEEGFRNVRGKTSLNDGYWHHVAATYDSQKKVQAIYVDGELENSAAITGKLKQVAGEKVNLGGRAEGWTTWIGLIDDVRLYDYAIEPEQVRTLALAGKNVIPKIKDLKLASGSSFIPELGKPVALEATVTDLNGDPLQYQWSAQPAEGVTFSPDASAKAPQVSFAKPGSHIITLRVDDGKVGFRHPELKVDVAASRTFVVGLARSESVDLTGQANRSRYGTLNRGWFGLRSGLWLQPGTHRIGGVAFELPKEPDSSANVGKTVIGLAPAQRTLELKQHQSDAVMKFPTTSEPIPVGKKADALFFLHTAAFAHDEPAGTPGWEYEIRYASEGAPREIVPVRLQVDVADEVYAAPPTPPIPGDALGLTGTWLYVQRWDNPHPDRVIESIVARSRLTKAAGVLVAVSTGHKDAHPAAKTATQGALLEVVRSEDRSYHPKPKGAGISVNLTQDGTRDWLQCGIDADKKPVVVRKANVPNRVIGEPYTVGQGTWRTYPKEPSTLCSWSDGEPIATGDKVDGGWWFRNNDNPGTAFGIAFPLAAETNLVRTVKFHCGRWGAAGTITVKLSDDSAPGYTHTSDVGWSTHNTFTIRYRAASAGQTLIIEWRNNGVVKDKDGNLQMIALTVSEGSDDSPPPAALPAGATKAAGTTTDSKPGQRAWAKAPIAANRIADVCQPVVYAAQRLDPESYLGRRVDLNFHTGLLKTFDVDIYLNSYGQNPTWPSGEYLGKFMQGLSAMYLYTGEAAAKERLDEIIATWRRVQAPDGWLGTTQRFKSWDIWEHKYVLLGLVDYHALTGDPAALEAARKIGDLLCQSVGPGLGDIMHSGHWALGSASILEPMTYLYRFTGERKYLGFCEYIVDAFEGPTGPKLISILTTGSRRVCDVQDTWANRAAREMKFGAAASQIRNRSKGYEMLSCIIGLARMYQLTGKPEYLAAAVNAWQDITANRLYLAGSIGADECFKDDHCLPAETSDGPAEGCVTAHWIFLSRLLFEITGEARYADAVENALYNYLLASQRPQDCHQSYNTGMNGTKNFARHDPSGKVRGAPCCISSVMREIARTPEALWTKFANQGVGVLLYQQGWMEDAIKTADGQSVSVRVEVETDFPRSGEVMVRVQPQRVAKFRVALRVPIWAKDFKATVADQTRDGTPGEFLNLERDWQPGDTVKITMDLNERLVSGGASYPGYFAFVRGPQVLTLVANKDTEGNLDRTTVKANGGAQLAPASGFLPGGWVGDQAYTTDALVGATGCALVPFGDAGQPGKPGKFRTWITADTGTTPAKPAAPSGLKASASAGNRIQLSWTDHSRGEAGFRVERKRADVDVWFHVKTTAPGVTTCVDDAVNVVLPGKTYAYRVAAYNAGGLSAYSEEVIVTTPDVVAPAAPSDLKITEVTASQIKLAWTDNSDNEEGFRIECRLGASDKWVVIGGRVPANLPAFTDYGLQPGQTYTYRARAFNAGGDSAHSNEPNATTPVAGSKAHSTTKDGPR